MIIVLQKSFHLISCPTRTQTVKQIFDEYICSLQTNFSAIDEIEKLELPIQIVVCVSAVDDLSY